MNKKELFAKNVNTLFGFLKEVSYHADNNGFFSITRGEIEEHTGISNATQKRICKYLETNNVIGMRRSQTLAGYIEYRILDYDYFEDLSNYVPDVYGIRGHKNIDTNETHAHNEAHTNMTHKDNCESLGHKDVTHLRVRKRTAARAPYKLVKNNNIFKSINSLKNRKKEIRKEKKLRFGFAKPTARSARRSYFSGKVGLNKGYTNGYENLLLLQTKLHTEPCEQNMNEDTDTMKHRNFVPREQEEVSPLADTPTHAYTKRDAADKPEKKTPYQRFADLINAYTTNEVLLRNLFAYLDMRLKISGKPLFVNQFKGMLNKLTSIAANDDEKILIVAEATSRAWANFFPVPGTTEYHRQHALEVQKSIEESKKAYDEKYNATHPAKKNPVENSVETVENYVPEIYTKSKRILSLPWEEQKAEIMREFREKQGPGTSPVGGEEGYCRHKVEFYRKFVEDYDKAHKSA